VRQEALEILADRAAARALGILERAAALDESEEVRDQALWLLGELPDGAGTPCLVKTARTHPHAGTRETALQALAESSDPHARTALLRMAEESR
jgi:HEAT repeat protein